MIVFVLAQRANPDEGPLSVAAHLFLPFMLYVDVSVICLEIIRIYHECEGRIERSVPRITVWNH